MSADTHYYVSVFREQQLQARVRVTTTTDPPLPQQTITTLAPINALPTSIHQHSLVSLPFFQLVITCVLLLQEEGEAFSREKESMASESSSKPGTHYTCGCSAYYKDLEMKGHNVQPYTLMA